MASGNSFEHPDKRRISVARWMVETTADSDGTANWNAAALFAQITWWCLPDERTGQSRAKHVHDGETWLVRSDDEWAIELGLSSRTVIRLRKRLVELQLIECRRMSDGSGPVMHVRRLFEQPDTVSGYFEKQPDTVSGYFEKQPDTVSGYIDEQPDTVSGYIDEQPDTVSGYSPASLLSLEKDVKTKMSNVDDEPAAIVVDLCDKLADAIERHSAAHKRPVPSKRWHRDMRLLLERGMPGVTPIEAIPAERVEHAIEFVFSTLAEPQGRDGFCWADQIRSPQALRDHWAQLLEAGRRLRGQHRGRTATMIDQFAREHGADVEQPPIAALLRPQLAIETSATERGTG